jgi:hypothetical protein
MTLTTDMSAVEQEPGPFGQWTAEQVRTHLLEVWGEAWKDCRRALAWDLETSDSPGEGWLDADFRQRMWRWQAAWKVRYVRECSELYLSAEWAEPWPDGPGLCAAVEHESGNVVCLLKLGHAGTHWDGRNYWDGRASVDSEGDW